MKGYTLRINHKKVGTLLVASLTSVAVLAATPAYAAKKPYHVQDASHTRLTAAVADKEGDAVYSVGGDYTAEAKGTYYLRVIVQKPGKGREALTPWQKAQYVGEISHVHRATWDFSAPKKFPDKTKIYTEIKGIGYTPAIVL